MRDKALQIMRVGAMTIIVVYHCLCYYGLWKQFSPGHVTLPYNNLLYTLSRVALILFVLISGYLYGRSANRNATRRQTLKSKVSRLLIPYCIWSVIAIVIFSEGNYLHDFLQGTQHLWFLLMLFLIFAICILFRLNRAKSIYLILISLVCVGISTTFSQADGGSILTWKSVIRYLPAFLAGVIFAKNEVAQRMRDFSTVQFILVYAASFATVIVFNIFKDTAWGFMLLYISLIWWTFCNYIVVFRLVDNNKPAGRVLSAADRHSMGIYLLHHLLLWGLFIFVPEICIFLDNHVFIGSVALIVLILSVSWALSYMLQANRYTRLLFDFKV